jgi:ribosome biogenesis SPOUT family RNA methylase Rps3
MKKIFIIEHLEKEMWPWCIIEYENSAKLVKPNKLIITNVKEGKYKFGENADIEKKSVEDMQLDWKRVCILDPKAKVELKPEDKENFDYFVFGGILGDETFNGRTGDELTKRLPAQAEIRHIGNKQFSTDNAVFVTKLIIDGKKLNEIKMQDNAEISIKEGESVILPYCYPILKGKPQISSKLISYLKKKKEF